MMSLIARGAIVHRGQTLVYQMQDLLASAGRTQAPSKILGIMAFDEQGYMILFYLELCVLGFGWLSSLWFLFYSEGVWDSSHQWSAYDFEFLVFAFFLLVPYVILGFFSYFNRHLTAWFLIESVILVFGSCWTYYSVYFPEPKPGAGWMFLLVPMVQALLALCISGSFVFFRRSF